MRPIKRPPHVGANSHMAISKLGSIEATKHRHNKRTFVEVGKHVGVLADAVQPSGPQFLDEDGGCNIRHPIINVDNHQLHNVNIDPKFSLLSLAL